MGKSSERSMFACVGAVIIMALGLGILLVGNAVSSLATIKSQGELTNQYYMALSNERKAQQKTLEENGLTTVELVGSNDDGSTLYEATIGNKPASSACKVTLRAESSGQWSLVTDTSTTLVDLATLRFNQSYTMCST